MKFVRNNKLNEEEFMRECYATYKLAIRFVDWIHLGKEYWHPFGLCGGRIDGLDLFHYYTGPSKFEDLALLTPERLAFVQICDLAGMPRELATDGHRVLPGDGDFQLEPLLQSFRNLGYSGWVSLELMNPTLWQTSAAQVAEIAVTSLRKALGLATARPERRQ